MKQKFIIGIDQSTQGTKAILFDENGNLLHRTDRSHAQLIDERGWVEHDPEEIYRISELELENAGHVSDSSSRIGYYITVKDQL